MAGSVEMSGGGAQGAGGLDELIRALARYSSALEKIAGNLDGSGYGPAPISSKPRFASSSENGTAFEAVSDWFKKYAPKATKIASAFMLKAPEIKQTPKIEPQKKDKTVGEEAPISLPKPISEIKGSGGGALENLMRQLVTIAEGIARKMGVTLATQGKEKSDKIKPPPLPKQEEGEGKSPTDGVKKGPGFIEPITAKQVASGSPAAIMAGGAMRGAVAGIGLALAAPVAFAEVISSVVGKITGFVAAINPGLVQTLGLAFRDLTAVVGIALQPVLQAIIPVVRQLTNAIFPLAKMIGKVISEIFEALQPAIDAITDTFFVMAEILIPVVQLIGDTLKFLAPAFVVLANVVKSVYIVFGTIVSAIVGIIRSLFGGLNKNAFKDAMQGVLDGLRLLTSAIIKGLAYILKFFGAISGINSMLNFLRGLTKPKADAAGIAAAQNAQFTSIEQVGKNAALAAVIATAVIGDKKERIDDQDFFADMITELEQIKDNGPTLIDAINALPAAIGSYIEALPSAIGKYISDAISGTGESIGKTAYDYNPLKVPGEMLGDMASWMIFGSSK